MKTLFAGLACSALLIAGAASAQPGQTANDITSRAGSAANPTPPADQTNTAAPAQTAPTGKQSRQAAQHDKCRKRADDKSLSGQARTQYLRNCPSKVAPR